jgi:hypothetical protein
MVYLFRYREVSLQANSRYLDALAAVEDSTNAKRHLDRVTTPKKDTAGRRCPGFNPLPRPRCRIIPKPHGRRALPARLHQPRHSSPTRSDASSASLQARSSEAKRQGQPHPFAASTLHRLIAKIPRTRRWRVTLYGRQVMGTSLYLRNHHFPNAYSKIAA